MQKPLPEFGQRLFLKKETQAARFLRAASKGRYMTAHTLSLIHIFTAFPGTFTGMNGGSQQRNGRCCRAWLSSQLQPQLKLVGACLLYTSLSPH